ncbi:MAG: hypothetical protein HQ593_04955 [Candidatus Omnitrophica bacterium]|nr:hypothetical protein [Candidatus Omnitrophota bacterium]
MNKERMQISAFIILAIGTVEIIIGEIEMLMLIPGLSHYASLIAVERIGFVVASIAAITSFCLGLGIVRERPRARTLLIFFSCLIVVSKLAILLKALVLPATLEIFSSTSNRHTISLIYHMLIVVALKDPVVHARFKKRSGAINP